MAIDWRFLRYPIERYASEQLGRPVTLTGFHMALRPFTTRLQFEGLRIGNVPDSRQPQMVALDIAEVHLSTWRALHKQILIEQLALRGGEVYLARARNGANNWTLPGRERNDMDVEALVLDNALIDYDDRQLDLTADIRTTTLRKPDAKGHTVQAEFNGYYGTARYQGKFATGPVISLRNAETPFPFRIDGRVGATRLKAEGTMQNMLGDIGLDATVDLSGPTLANLAPFVGIAFPNTPPFAYRGRLARTNGKWDATQFAASLGRSDLTGDLAWDPRGGDRPKLTGDIHSRVFDIQDIAPLFGWIPDAPPVMDRPRTTASRNAASGTTSASRAASSRAASSSSASGGGASGAAARGGPARSASLPRGKPEPKRRVLPDWQFDVTRLRANDADLKVDMAVLRSGTAWSFESVAGRALLDQGQLTLSPFTVGYAGGQFSAKVTFDARSTPGQAALTGTLQKARYGRMFVDASSLRRSEGMLGADIRLTGSGDTFRDVLGSASGAFGVILAGGNLSTLVMDGLAVDTGPALSHLIGPDKRTVLRCAVAAFDVQKGVARTQTLLLDTPDARLAGQGTVAFADERLDLRLVPVVKDAQKEPVREGGKEPVKEIAAAVARSPIAITGTLAFPDVRADRAGGVGVTSAGMAPPAGATPGSSGVSMATALVPLVDTGYGRDANCGVVLGQDGESTTGRRARSR
ncbi:AsmA family protein [Pigmentiphaga litoralis]|uniref:AsmA family protein n=1 Tax=Pigmentiphaga litoralis TaxID=516702 RepID=UPI003B433B0A